MFEDVKSHPFFQTIDFAHLEAGLIPPPFIPNVSINNVLHSFIPNVSINNVLHSFIPNVNI